MSTQLLCGDLMNGNIDKLENAEVWTAPIRKCRLKVCSEISGNWAVGQGDHVVSIFGFNVHRLDPVQS